VVAAATRVPMARRTRAPAGSTIASSTALVVSFDEAMNTSSLALSGSLGLAAHAAWDGTSKTLTLTPLAAWPEGASQHLGLSVSDLAGNAIIPIDAAFSVLNGVVYVKTTGSNSNPGTSDSPKATIPAAITQAANYFATAEVHVAQGTYDVSIDAGTHIVMKRGIAVMGGYSSSSWATRDWTANTTTIQDIASTGGAAFDYKEVVYFDSATDAQSIIDGFTIIAPSGVGRSDGVLVSGGSPVIRNNRIYGGATVVNFALGIEVRGSNGALISHNTIYARGAAGSDTLGINDYQSSSRIEYNDIDGGAGERCVGINLDSSSSTVIFANTVYGGSGNQSRAVAAISSVTMMTLENNVLHGGAGSSVRGVYIDSPGIIRNNTICGGGNGDPRGITIDNTSAAITIDNNIIFSGSSTGGYGIEEMSTAPHPSLIVRNNDIWGCPDGLYYHGLVATTIADMEAYLGGRGATASGNVSVDPSFISPRGADNDLSTMNDNNWSLSATSPVKDAGLNGAKEDWDFTTDVTGAARTPLDSSVTGWSMGAYEVN